MKFAFALTLLSAVSAWSATNIAVIDMPRAIQSTSEGKKAKTELETEFEKKKKEFQGQENNLKKMGEDLEKKKSVLSQEALEKKQNEFQEEMMKFREKVQKSQADIHKRQQELTEPIVIKMKKVVDRLAKEKNFGLVLELTPGILYADKSRDITDDVIKAYEKEK